MRPYRLIVYARLLRILRPSLHVILCLLNHTSHTRFYAFVTPCQSNCESWIKPNNAICHNTQVAIVVFWLRWRTPIPLFRQAFMTKSTPFARMRDIHSPQNMGRNDARAKEQADQNGRLTRSVLPLPQLMHDPTASTDAWNVCPPRPIMRPSHSGKTDNCSAAIARRWPNTRPARCLLAPTWRAAAEVRLRLFDPIAPGLLSPGS